jgi:hypothetical protein
VIEKKGDGSSVGAVQGQPVIIVLQVSVGKLSDRSRALHHPSLRIRRSDRGIGIGLDRMK